MMFDERNPIFYNPPFFVSMATAAKFVQPMWMLFLSSFINFCLVSNMLWSFLCFYFFSILAVSMATAAILKKSTLKGTTSDGI
jgi:hypothetical protein